MATKKNFSSSIAGLNVFGGPGSAAAETEARPFGGDLREQIAATTTAQQEIEVSIDLLLDNPYQRLSRSGGMDQGQLQELADSIRASGFIGTLYARQLPGSPQYELAFGHRRREAARLVGLTYLPIKVIQLDNWQMLRIMSSENFSRVDLDPADEAEVIGQFEQARNLSAQEIGREIGKSKGWVQERLALYHAPQELKQLVKDQPGLFSHAGVLVRVKDATTRANLIQAVLDEGLTVKQLETRLKALLAPPPAPVPAEPVLPVKQVGDDFSSFDTFADEPVEGIEVDRRPIGSTTKRPTAVTRTLTEKDIPIYHNGAAVSGEVDQHQEPGETEDWAWKGELKTLYDTLETLQGLAADTPPPAWVKAKLEAAKTLLEQLLIS